LLHTHKAAGYTSGASSVGVAGGNVGTATDKIAATGQQAFTPAMQTAHIGEIVQRSTPDR